MRAVYTKIYTNKLESIELRKINQERRDGTASAVYLHLLTYAYGVGDAVDIGLCEMNGHPMDPSRLSLVSGIPKRKISAAIDDLFHANLIAIEKNPETDPSYLIIDYRGVVEGLDAGRKRKQRGSHTDCPPVVSGQSADCPSHGKTARRETATTAILAVATPPQPPASGGSGVAIAGATDPPAIDGVLIPPPEKPERVTRWTAKTFTQEQAAVVFERWRVCFKKDKRTIFSADRIKSIHARAKQGMTFVEAKLAVIGCVEDGKRWYPPGDCKVNAIGAMIEWNYIFRNRTSVERYVAIALKKLGEQGVRVSDDGNALVDKNGNEITSVRL